MFDIFGGFPKFINCFKKMNFKKPTWIFKTSIVDPLKDNTEKIIWEPSNSEYTNITIFERKEK